MVKYLLRDGHDVRVVTSGAFGQVSDPDIERHVTRTRDLMGSARLRRLARLAPLAAPDQSIAATRVAQQADEAPGADPELPKALTHVLVPDPFLVSWAPFALGGAMRALRERPVDCVVTSSPNESTHLVGVLLKRRFGHAWIADLRDGWTFERFLPEFPTAGQRALNRRLERLALRRADAVVAATRPIADDVRARYGIDAQHVPNAWDPDLDPTLPASEAGRGEVRLVHTGKLRGEWGRDPAPLFAALRRLLDEEPELGDRVRLVVAGKLDVADARLMEDARLGDAVTHVGQLPRAEALRLQRSADTLILVTSPNSGEATGKLYEYLAAERPILALAADNEAARIVRETGTGVAVDPGDPDAILDALRAAVRGELHYAPKGLAQFRHPTPSRRIAAIAASVLQ
jgi:glycosyltransferase involved in cell wall biosynthesis